MKNKRWLFVLLAVLIAINVSVLIISRFTDYKDWTSNQLVQIIERHLTVEAKIADLRFTDRQLTLSGLELRDKSDRYKIKINHIYVNYNLFKLIFSRLKLFKGFESVSIIEPVVEIYYESVHEPGNGSPMIRSIDQINLPDLSGYFSKLSITNGALTIEYFDNNFHFTDQFSDISLEISNKEKTTGLLKIHKQTNRANSGSGPNNENYAQLSQESNVIELSFELENGNVPLAQLVINHLELEGLELYGIELSSLELSLDAQFVQKQLRVNGSLRNLQAYFQDSYEVEAAITDFVLVNDFASITSDEFYFDGNKGGLSLGLEGIFAESPQISATFFATGIQVEKYLDGVSGALDLLAEIDGYISKPEVKITLSAPVLEFADEQLNDVVINADYQNDEISFVLTQAEWQGNIVSGTGSADLSGRVEFHLLHNGFVFISDGWIVKGDFEGRLLYEKGLEISARLENLNLENKIVNFNGMNLTASLSDSMIHAKLNGSRFRVDFESDLDFQNYTANVVLSGLDPNQIFKKRSSLIKSYPHLSGSIGLQYYEQNLNSNARVRMFNPRFGELEGSFVAGMIYSQGADSLHLNLHTLDTTINNEPFLLNMEVTGNRQSLKTEKLIINNEIHADLSLQLAPELSLNASVTTEGIDLKSYLQYFLTPYTANDFSGSIAFDVDFEFPGNTRGGIIIDDIAYKRVHNFKNILVFDGYYPFGTEIETGENFKLQYQNSLQSSTGEELLSLNGVTLFNESLDTEIVVTTVESDLAKIIPELDLSGFINGYANYRRDSELNLFTLDLSAHSLEYQNVSVDSLVIRAKQYDDLFELEEFRATGGSDLLFTGGGRIGYNLFNRKITTSDDVFDISFSGDILSIIAHSTKYIERGRSQTNASFTIGIVDDELSFTSGSFVLTRGQLSVKDQPQQVENITIDITADNNRLLINRFDARIGQGSVYIRNEHVGEEEESFRLGMLNIGDLYIRSSSSGINVHVPSYLPPNTTGDVVIRGRGQTEALVSGPFDDIKIIADLYISNAAITYPPGTENLFKIINIATERRKESVSVSIPIDLDLKLIARNQVRYITYPMNLLLVSDSYIHLLYHDDNAYVKDSFFSSETGSLDMFGSNFTLDYAELKVNYDLNDYRLRGYFYRYAVDGSLISMNIYNENTGSPESLFENLDFSLESDNPEDRTMLHVLSKLRYNRRLEDIPRSQQNSLLQDEFLQLAGMGIAGVLVDPFLFPLENRLRRALKLDYFSLKPGLMENLVSTYGYSERERELSEENEMIKFGKNILLNNLSINMGKLLARDFYLDYEFLLQKPVDVVDSNNLLVYQNFTFFYNLPYKMRLAYRFYLKPEREKNSHEIFVRRSFSFW